MFVKVGVPDPEPDQVLRAVRLHVVDHLAPGLLQWAKNSPFGLPVTLISTGPSGIFSTACRSGRSR